MYQWLVKYYYYFLNKKKQAYIDKLVSYGLTLGKNVEIVEDFFFDPSHCFLISIGDDCTFAPGVRLIAHDASTYKHLGYTKIGKIIIGKKCFLGDSVTILPGITIGDNCIIGAGSVVTKDIPGGMIAAGNPAKTICSVSSYLEKIQKIAATKKIFDETYSIENLDSIKRREILDSLENSIGFIV